jgi:starvation-inducible DNA-binding protein
MSELTIDIGINETARAEITEGRARLLADTYTLYLKTHNYHWNVTGPMFQTLHLMFETQYNELALAVDLIAERIRALGAPAPGGYREFASLSSVGEDEDQPDAREMIRRLVKGQETVVRTARSSSPSSNGPTTNRLLICSRNACRSMKRRRGCSAACSPDQPTGRVLQVCPSALATSPV